MKHVKNESRLQQEGLQETQGVQQVSDNLKTAKKSQWLEEEMWRKVWPWEQDYADRLRRALVSDGACYVVHSRDDDPEGCSGETANHRGALAQILEELSLDDLNAVYYIARLLLICPDMVNVHELARRRDEWFHEWYLAHKKQINRQRRLAKVQVRE